MFAAKYDAQKKLFEESIAAMQAERDELQQAIERHPSLFNGSLIIALPRAPLSLTYELVG